MRSSRSKKQGVDRKHHKVKRQLQQRYYNSQAEEATQKDGAKDAPSQVVEITPNLERFSQGAAKKRFAQWKHGFRDVDPYPDDAPVPKEKMVKYDHGAGSIQVPRKGLGATVLKHIKEDSHFAQIQAAKAEQLNDDAGFLEVEEGEDASRLSQHEIAKSVDVTSATKYFELNLPQFGPYNINYSRNGRHMLLGGAKGHMAAFDWQTKRLLCEFNAMETVHDVRWLHQETLLAAAQKSGVYIYDNQGIELHALTDLDSVLNMEFLPYHFLLCTANAKGYMAYTDVSMGTKVSGYNTGMGRLNVMCQNPANAIIHLGHFSGTVTMWSPNVKGSLVKMLCHKSGVTSVAVDNTGNYMATSAIDRKLRLWDLRTYKMLHSYKLSIGAKSIAFSQRGCLALSTGSLVQMYNDILQNSEGPFLNHLCSGAVQRVQFCPFEDVLGVGHLKGFSSLIVPGSGEANIDALEVNPYATKKQRANAEVRMLLDKIPPEMINLSTKVTEISSQPSHSGQKQVPTHKKLGKKEKEQEMREKVRDTQNRKFTPKNGNRKSGSDAIFDRFKKKE
ncbi:hypothetical protein C0Q70_17786 [Pomacea canaliculata]|uniref:BING4 C-terminal domain-containing protein n=1 Tax=Pomacea canaliculata TaxID=400727 RepID=A0A2T7NLD8_POMCA|nr:hypothetical protein C0Q70_17786 [Pomacea canaliculata]